MFCQIATGSLLLSAIGVLPDMTTHCLACSGHTTLLRARRSTSRSRFVRASAADKPSAPAENRAIEFLIEIPFPREQPGERTRPPAAATRPRQRHRPLLRDLRRRRRRADAADHGARRPDDPLGRRFLPATRRARLSRHPVRQSRHRPVQQTDRRQAPRPGRTAQAALPENPGRGTLQAARHGAGRDRADGCARHQVGASGRRVDGRHDRPGNRDLVSAAGALAHLDHVDNRQSKTAAADPGGRRRC